MAAIFLPGKAAEKSRARARMRGRIPGFLKNPNTKILRTSKKKTILVYSIKNTQKVTDPRILKSSEISKIGGPEIP